ncbi:MAG: hypothetical protein A2Z52_00860 [Candidatus Moranbacteria bacterium RBG_19FT_COMBO_42_6]|nr:MAG: hypothetical protein A2Z52_00860 [Candidatus Moranbacteria bacterium RBG_19FT_COMBO_42_6]
MLYHGVINDVKWKPDEVSIRTDDFKKQMFTLKKAGYQSIRLEDYLAFIKGEKELPEKSFMITFDDGRKDSYYPVDPILRALDYMAVMNVITGRSLGLDKEKTFFHLSQTELRKMIDSGRWEMDSHGRNDHDYIRVDSEGKDGHFLSNKLWLAEKNRLETEEEYKKRIYDDLLGSKNDLEKKLGVKVLAFAYPFNDFGQASENFPESRDIIVNTASSIFPLSLVQSGSSDFPTNYAENSFLAKRITVSSLMSSEELLQLLENGQSKSMAYEDNFSQNKGWLRGWGNITVEKSGMFISNSKEDDSGLAFLSGSYLWKDYFAQAKVSLLKGNAFAFNARYYDENNYVSCDFSDGFVSLTQRIKGKGLPDIEVLQQTGLTSGREAEVGIYVVKDQASCYLNGKPVVTGTIEKDLEHGGISFKIWDSERKGTMLQVKKIQVSENPQIGLNF